MTKEIKILDYSTQISTPRSARVGRREHQNGIQEVDVWWTEAHGTSSRMGHMHRQHKEKDRRGALTRWPPTLPAAHTNGIHTYGEVHCAEAYPGQLHKDNHEESTHHENLGHSILQTTVWVGNADAGIPMIQ